MTGTRKTPPDPSPVIIARLDVGAEYRALGVRFASDQASPEGWIPCHAIDRDDTTPSAAVNIHTGRYKDHGGEGDNLSLWDFAARHGPFLDWKAARDHFATKAGVDLGTNAAPEPAQRLDFRPWHEGLVALWCRHKRGITPEAVQAAGGRRARYRYQFQVIALPVWQRRSGNLREVGWTLFNSTGATLPVFHAKGQPPTWEKMKTTAGSRGGLMGDVARLEQASLIWKVEGPTDMLAAWSIVPEDQRDQVAIVCNSNGSNEHPKEEHLELLEGKPVYVIHDADRPGETGAERWCQALVKRSPDVRQVRLPYEVAENHGRDLRDWILEGHGYADLLELAGEVESAAVAEPIANAEVIEHDDEQKEILPLHMNAVLARIRERTEDWPRRVGSALFVHEGRRVDWLENTAATFGWLAARTGRIDWYKAKGCVTQEQVYHELRRTSTEYQAVEEFPHEPKIPGHYYACEPPEPGDGTALQELLERFTPATDVDRDLIQAALMTTIWGGGSGLRPAFVFTSAAGSGRGSGKSKLAQKIGQVVGGVLDFSHNEDIAQIKQRLLSAGSATTRIALLDNVKSLRFSWAELEAIVTADTISGKRLYIGEAKRPNTMTWFLTLNGASLSTDMAQRCVVVKLVQPRRSGTWEEEINSFIERHRWDIIADLVAALRAPAVELSSYSRWGAWEEHVLSRLPEPADAQRVILERQATVDVESEELDILAEFIERQLRLAGFSTRERAIFIPSRIMADWYNTAHNDRKQVTAISRIIRQHCEEGHLPRLRVETGRRWGRGFIWEGPEFDVTDYVRRDLPRRLAEGNSQGGVLEEEEDWDHEF